MTRGEIWKDFFKRTVLPAVIALFLFFMFKNVFTEDGQTNYFYVWLCCGIPFGIRRMFVWLVPHGYDIAGSSWLHGISPLRYTVYLPQIRAQPLKSTWKNSKGKTGTQTVSKDYPRPGFLMGAVLKCYAVERRF